MAIEMIAGFITLGVMLGGQLIVMVYKFAKVEQRLEDMNGQFGSRTGTVDKALNRLDDRVRDLETN